MTSRERVLTAMHLGKPDRVPFVDEIDRSMKVEIMGKEEFSPMELAQEMGFDALTIAMSPPFFAERALSETGKEFIKESQIKSRDDLKNISFPKIDYEFLSKAEKFVENYGASDYALGLVTRMGCSGVLNSFGLEEFSYFLVDDPYLVETLFDMYVEWACELLDKAQGLGFDFVKFADDIAYNSGPIVSPQLFREMFLPRMKTVANHVKLPWIYHSDGNLLPIFEDLLSLGMNVVNPIEPGAMDINFIKEKYGKRICIHGNIDLRYTLTMGTPEEVEEEVRTRIENIGKDGGYIIASSNSITNYCKIENIFAMRDAILKYGAYN